jgi:multicomponent Na+:H+ antiporter subunit G
MMALVVDALSWVFLATGGGFVIVGGVGILRMPDVYTRAHAASLTDMAGAGLILVGLMLQAGPTLITAKLVLILVFLWTTSPVATHALIHTAFASDVRPVLHHDESGAPSAEEAPSPRS